MINSLNSYHNKYFNNNSLNAYHNKYFKTVIIKYFNMFIIKSIEVSIFYSLFYEEIKGKDFRYILTQLPFTAKYPLQQPFESRTTS